MVRDLTAGPRTTSQDSSTSSLREQEKSFSNTQDNAEWQNLELLQMSVDSLQARAKNLTVNHQLFPYWAVSLYCC